MRGGPPAWGVAHLPVSLSERQQSISPYSQCSCPTRSLATRCPTRPQTFKRIILLVTSKPQGPPALGGQGVGRSVNSRRQQGLRSAYHVTTPPPRVPKAVRAPSLPHPPLLLQLPPTCQ